jgi:hypothetical protein
VADRNNSIESISTSDRVARYTTGSKQPMEITTGPGHALWFTVPATSRQSGRS